MSDQTETNILKLDSKTANESCVTNQFESKPLQFETVTIKKENENLFEEIEYPTNKLKDSKVLLDVQKSEGIKLEAEEVDIKNENDIYDTKLDVPKSNTTNIKTENSSIVKPSEKSSLDKNGFDWKSFLRDNNGSLECVACDYKTHSKAYFARHAKTVHYYKTAAPKFQCLECLYKTSAQHKLNRHIKLKHNPNLEIHKCPHCSYETNWKYILRNHVASMHGDAGFKCPHCQHVAKWKTNLRKHIFAKHPDKCDEKTLAKLKNKALQSCKVAVNLNTNAIGYTCIYCDHKTKWRGSMSKHVKMKHNINGEVYFCDHCPYSTKDRHSLRLHNRKKHEEHPKKFKCPYCDFRSSEKCYVDQHIGRKHTENNTEMQCTHCPYKTKSRTYFRNHLNTRHSKKGEMATAPECNVSESNMDPSDDNSTANSSELFLFDSLNFEMAAQEISNEETEHPHGIVAATRQYLDQNASEEMNDNTHEYPENPASMKENMREDADLGIERESELYSELKSLERSEEPSFEDCEDIMKNTSEDSMLEDSQDISDLVLNDTDEFDDTVPDIPEYLTLDTLEHNSEIKPLKNPLVEENKFDYKQFLRINNDIFECTACTYKATSKAYFSRHVRAIHGNRAPNFKCPDCDYKTTAQYRLNRHVRNRHNTDNIYKCPHCTFVAKWNYKLQSHIKNKHDTKNVGFKCPYCSHVNNYKANLKRHIVLKHVNKGEVSASDAKMEIKQEISEDDTSEIKCEKNCEDIDVKLEKIENETDDC